MGMNRLIKRLPYPIEQTLRYIYSIIPIRIRYGKTFWKTYEFLQESQWWSAERLRDYQMRQLAVLLDDAYKHVPYYRRVFNERDLTPKDIQNLDDLQKLPYLTKDIFRSQFGEMVAENAALRKLIGSHTSGTTGTPLQFYDDTESGQKELAFIYHQWARVGVKPDDAMVQLRGSIIGGRRFRYNPTNKVLRLSPQINDRDTAAYYLDKMRRFGAKYLHGYPAIIAVFASMIKKYGLPAPPKLGAVLFASEVVYPWQTEIVEDVFGCRAFSHYGMAEHAVLAGQCESSRSYHCLPQYGVTEVDSQSKEIIGTGFLNHVNPFIRYKTTDAVTSVLDSSCEACGRHYTPVFPGIDGRFGDLLITPEGVAVSPAVVTHPFKDFKAIKETQLIQTSLNHVKVKVVAWTGCDGDVLDEEIRQLRGGLASMLGAAVEIEDERVDAIRHDAAGKFKWIVSHVPQDSMSTLSGSS